MATVTEELKEQLSNEVHPVLANSEMKEIKSFREKLAYKTTKETEKLIFEWTKTGKLNSREHTLLCKYVYQGY